MRSVNGYGVLRVVVAAVVVAHVLRAGLLDSVVADALTAVLVGEWVRCRPQRTGATGDRSARVGRTVPGNRVGDSRRGGER